MSHSKLLLHLLSMEGAQDAARARTIKRETALHLCVSTDGEETEDMIACVKALIKYPTFPFEIQNIATLAHARNLLFFFFSGEGREL